MYTTEHLYFETKDHLRLPGLLFSPKAKTEKAVIYLHGNGSSSVFYAVEENLHLATVLSNKGIAFLTFNNRGANQVKSFHLKKNGKDERQLFGSAFEKIKDCLIDIDSAISYLKKRGFKTFYLVGASTGANKIVIYDYYRKKNLVKKYILLSGGDDTGLYYDQLGKNKFKKLLDESKNKIRKGQGREFVPYNKLGEIISYQSLYDIINPDGDYNIFAFNERINNLGLSKKPLFKEFKSINKPTLIIYGQNDEFCYGNVPKCVEVLKKETTGKSNFEFSIIRGADHSFNSKEIQLAEIIGRWI